MRVPPVVQVISFDAMNTLITPSQPVAKTYVEIAGKFGVATQEEYVAASIPKLFARMAKKEPCYGHGSIGPYEWWKKVIVGALESGGAELYDGTHAGEKRADQIARAIYTHFTHADSWLLTDEELRLKGIALCVTSNFDGRLKGILQHLSIAPHMSMHLVSGELGLEKPDARVFEVIMRHFSLTDASTLLHIGDDFDKDYRAAKSFGARSLLFDPKGAHKEAVPSQDRLESFSQLRIY